MKQHPAIGEVIELLVCDIGARPKGAPAYDDVAPHVHSVERNERTLRIIFEDEVAASVEAFAAAERVCCSTIGFDVARDPLVLTITAATAQLDVMQQLLRPS